MALYLSILFALVLMPKIYTFEQRQNCDIEIITTFNGSGVNPIKKKLSHQFTKAKFKLKYVKQHYEI